MRTFLQKWWIYQRERFPVVAHGLLIGAFSFSAVGFSRLLRGEETWAPWWVLAVAFGNSFCAFLHLRIADEFKDAEEDARFRPYRAVPRGLVTLRELGWLGGLTAGLQVGLALWLDSRLLGLLLLAWSYLFLMSHEFFAREWLKARPFTYLWTHMLIMPLIDFYATACDWLSAGGAAGAGSGGGPPEGLIWFVSVSFFNGVVIEIGRKIRAPEQEEAGVATYTVTWGRTGAVVAWLVALSANAASALAAARLVGFLWPAACVLAALLALAAALAVAFARGPTARRAKFFEPLSAVWTLAMYLTLGVAPMLAR